MNKLSFNKNLRARFYQNTTVLHNLNFEAELTQGKITERSRRESSLPQVKGYLNNKGNLIWGNMNDAPVLMRYMHAIVSFSGLPETNSNPADGSLERHLTELLVGCYG